MMVDFVFVTNSRGKDIDWGGYCQEYKDWRSPSWVPPDVFDWKGVCFNFHHGLVVKGRILVIGSSAEDINTIHGAEKASHQIKKAVDYAKNLGAKIIGVGASTKRLIDYQSEDFIYTCGDSLTGAVILEDLIEVAGECGIDIRSSQTRLMIIGAYGLIGASITKEVKDLGCKLVLVGPNFVKLKRLNEGIDNKAIIVDKLSNFPDAVDIIITATNHPDSLLTIADLNHLGSRGVLIIDVAQPPNVSLELCKQFKDMIRIDSGIVYHPQLSYEGGKSFSGLKDNEAFACLAEVIILSTMLKTKGITASEFMKVNLWNKPIINEYAKSYRFKRIPLSCYGEVLSEDRIKEFKRLKGTK